MDCRGHVSIHAPCPPAAESAGGQGAWGVPLPGGRGCGEISTPEGILDEGEGKHFPPPCPSLSGAVAGFAFPAFPDMPFRNVSIHSRPIRRRMGGHADCPSPQGGGTEKDFIGFAVLSDALFPLKGEVSNHKGIFDEMPGSDSAGAFPSRCSAEPDRAGHRLPRRGRSSPAAADSGFRRESCGPEHGA